MKHPHSNPDYSQDRVILKITKFLICAARRGVRDLDAALAVADLSRLEVDLTNSTVSGMDAVFEALRTTHPHLFESQPANQSPGMEKPQESPNPNSVEAQRARAIQSGRASDFGEFFHLTRKREWRPTMQRDERDGS
jgi:hypothetical protein